MLTHGAFEDPELIKCSQWLDKFRTEYQRVIVNDLWYNGIQFTNHERHVYAFEHIFDRVCREHQIEHRLTKIKHPWTNGQVERMNRTIKEPQDQGSDRARKRP